MAYDFDTVLDRRGTNCAKFDEMDWKYGPGLMHLGVADMDFRSPQPILDAFSQVVEKGVFGYTVLPQNYPALVRQWMQRRYDCAIQEEWVLFSPRINMAANMAVETFTQPGDGILLHTPAYTALQAAISKYGRRTVESPLVFRDGEYQMDFEQMEQLCDESVKMLIFCNPQNPTCRVWRREELERLADFCCRHNLLVISDEIHGDIVPEGTRHTSLLSLGEDMNQRTILCNSITKTFNVPGVIFSNVIIPNPDIRRRMAETIDRWGLHNPTIFAAAMLEPAYTQCDDWLREVNRYIRANYDYLAGFIRDHLPGLKLMPSEGTYLAWINTSQLGMPEEELERFFLEKARVSVYMGSRYSQNTRDFIRINLACSRAYLTQALEQIKEHWHLIAPRQA